LFFFVQNFVDFERTINKRYPNQTASAPILRVLIQKSFDKQNEEIPLLKDELIVSTNSVASRESINNLLDKLYYTNFTLYEDLKQGLDLFPTMQEKINIVKFPEKKFREENEIKAWGDLPNNKQVQELADLYEQLNAGTSTNIESTQNQINNLEESIGNQLIASEQNLYFANKSTMKQERVNMEKEETLVKEKNKQDTNLFKDIGERSKSNFKNKIVGTRTPEKYKGLEPPQGYIKEQPGYSRSYYFDEPKTARAKIPAVFEGYQTTKQVEKMPKGMIPPTGYVTPSNKGSFKFETISVPAEKPSEKPIKFAYGRPSTEFQKQEPISAKSAPKPRGNLKQNTFTFEQEPISAEPVEQEELYITPRKVQSNKTKTKAEVVYKNDAIPESSLKVYLDKMDNITKRDELRALAKTYNIVFDKVKDQYGTDSMGALKRVIAINQYEQDNKYTTIPIELEPLNELTRGSYSDKVFILDPNASTSRQPPMEGTGLLTKRQQDSHRFKVLQGQILAGNNSKKIVMELKTLILKMNKLGEISNKKASAVLQELNSVLK
jgi:hypothetical protein